MIQSAVQLVIHFSPILIFVLALAARLGWECGGGIVALAGATVRGRR